MLYRYSRIVAKNEDLETLCLAGEDGRGRQTISEKKSFAKCLTLLNSFP